MLWSGASDPPRSRDSVHQTVRLALTEPSDLTAPTTNDALARIIGNHKVAHAKSLDGHLFNLCRLGASAAFDNLLDHRAGGLARLVLPVIVAAAERKAVLGPDDLRPH